MKKRKPEVAQHRSDARRWDKHIKDIISLNFHHEREKFRPSSLVGDEKQIRRESAVANVTQWTPSGPWYTAAGSRGPLQGTAASSSRFMLSSPTPVPALPSEDFLVLDPSFLVLSPKYVKGFGLRHAALQLLLVWLDPAPQAWEGTRGQKGIWRAGGSAAVTQLQAPWLYNKDFTSLSEVDGHRAFSPTDVTQFKSAPGQLPTTGDRQYFSATRKLGPAALMDL